MQHNYSKAGISLLLESPETLSSIVRLAWAILNLAGTLGETRIRDRIETGDTLLSWLDADDLGAVTLAALSRKALSGLDPGFRSFIKDMVTRHLRIAFSASGNLQGRRAAGWFRAGSPGSQPEIIIVIGEAEFEPVKDALRDYPARLGDAIRHVLKPHTDTLIHELTHAYDEWASKGRWQNNKRSITAHAAEQDRRWDRKDPTKAQTAYSLYMNNPIEINARYTETVAKLEQKRTTTSWKEYRSTFMYNMDGWRNLPEEDKRRLLVRLATQWQEGRNTLRHDVEGACKRLQTRLQATDAGADVWLSSRNNDQVLNVDGIKLKKPDQIAAFLRPILVLADHYGMTVTLGDKLPIPAVRPLGFVNQRPRSVNGGLRDYSLPWRTVYFRRPVDRRQAAA